MNTTVKIFLKSKEISKKGMWVSLPTSYEKIINIFKTEDLTIENTVACPFIMRKNFSPELISLLNKLAAIMKERNMNLRELTMISQLTTGFLEDVLKVILKGNYSFVYANSRRKLEKILIYTYYGNVSDWIFSKELGLAFYKKEEIF